MESISELDLKSNKLLNEALNLYETNQPDLAEAIFL
jgi:hypothetical protein